MGVKIIPAVLAADKKSFLKRLRQADRLSKVVHLDLTDGLFVRQKTVGSLFLKTVKTNSRLEVHLMVKNPADWWPSISHFNIVRLIIHVEIGNKIIPLVALCRSRKIKIFLAIKPHTPILALKKYSALINGIEVMAVDPGRYGAPQIKGLIKRINLIKRKYPKLELSIDGGIKETNIGILTATKPKYLTIGSAIMKSSDPRLAYRRLQLAAKA